MNGIFRGFDERENAVKSPLPEGDLKRSAGSESKSAGSRDIGEKKIFKARIVRDVQENRSFPNFRLCGVQHSSSSTNASF